MCYSGHDTQFAWRGAVVVVLDFVFGKTFASFTHTHTHTHPHNRMHDTNVTH